MRSRAERALVLAVIPLLFVAARAEAAPTVQSYRYEGADRYETAAVVATASDFNGIRVVIASGESFPDGLAATAAAGYHGSPVLLTPPGSLHPATAAALEELGPGEVVLIGGKAAISSNVEYALRDLGYETSRVAGADRYQTAERVAVSMSDSGCHCPPWEAVVVSGEVYADAVSAGPILSGSGSSRSLLLTRKDELPQVTADHLRTGVTDVVIVGGTSAVSLAVEEQIRGMCRPGGAFDVDGESCIEVRRVAGPTRQETAVAVAEYALREHGWTPTHAMISYGYSFPDALVAGRRANRHEGVSLLTASVDELGEPARAFLERYSSTWTTLDIIGDRTVVTDSVVYEARSAARGV